MTLIRIDEVRTGALFALLLGAAALACGGEAPTRPAPAGPPASFELRYRFPLDVERRYESKTVERAARETTIELRYRQRAVALRGDGAGEVEVVIERYQQRIFPPTLVGPEVRLLNEGLAGARFRLAISPDGRQVEHLGQEGVPEISAYGLEALRTTLRSHVLRLPQGAIRAGQRWSVDSAPAPDAGPEAVRTTSRWRVTTVGPAGAKQLVELVCLATMEPGLLELKGQKLRNRTEFHYSYLWNATEGLLEGLSSRGTTSTVLFEERDGGPPEPQRQQVQFEASLRRLSGP